VLLSPENRGTGCPKAAFVAIDLNLVVGPMVAMSAESHATTTFRRGQAMHTAGLNGFAAMLVWSTVAALVSPTGSSRADFQPGREAYLRGDYSEALALFLPFALQGDAKSQIGLGLLYARGHGIEADRIRSYSWFEMAVRHAEQEHIIVRILARTNRDYLAKQMSAEEVARARLWSTMALAKTEPLTMLPEVQRRKVSVAKVRTAASGGGMSRTVHKNSAAILVNKDAATPALVKTGAYRIQLAARRQGQTAELRGIWRKLSERYDFLRKLEPELVQMDLGDAGVYEGLRAGLFDDSRNAHRMCRGLIEDKQDCIVVKR
jgi:hypothetical protein